MSLAKKIGKFVIVLYCSTSYGQEVSLQAVSTHGTPSSQFAVGIPFDILVTLSQDAQIIKPVDIPGIEAFSQLQQYQKKIGTFNAQQSQMRQINGFRVRAEKPGMYRVGPASVTTNEGTFTSGELTITVSEQQQTMHAQEVTATLTSRKKKVYVGEKIELTLSVVLKDGAQQVSSLSRPEADWIDSLSVDGPFTRQSSAGQTEFTWKINGYAKKAGDFAFGPISIDYLKQQKMSDHDLFARFFNSFAEHKTAYSTRQLFTVKELPQTKEAANGVGIFEQLSFKLEKNTVALGQALQAVLEVTGEGDLENLKAPALKLPEHLTWYESKTSRTPRSKQFEYIIQPLEPGSYEIQPQEFVYFDPNSGSYKKLKSQTENLTVEGQALQSPPPSEPNRSEAPVSESQPVLSQDQELTQLQSAHWSFVPWWLFWLLSIATLAALFCTALVQRLLPRISQYYQQYVSKRAFVRARARINKALEADDFALLLPIFHHAIAQRLQVPATTVTSQFVAQHAKEFTREWEDFYDQLSLYAFTPEKSKLTKQELRRACYYWLDQCDKRL